MSPPIKTTSKIDVPVALVPQIEQLVTDWAREMELEIEDARRLVEISLLQRGIAAVREGLKA